MTQAEAEVILKVNDQQSREKLEKLEDQAKRLRKEFADAFKNNDTKAISEINKKLQKVNKEISNLRTNAANIKAAMSRLDEASPRELQRTIKLINNELNSGRVKRGSEEWRTYTKQLREVNEELQSLLKTQRNSEGFFTRLTQRLTQWWGTYTILTDAISNVNMRFSQMRQDQRDKEESQANLQALTGLDDSSIAWLTEQAEKLSTTMDETGLRITQSSKEILDAYMLVGSNKPELLSDKEALNEVTIEAMRLAAAAKMELQPAVDAMTTSLNQYGEGAEAAARYVNVLAAGSKFGAANVEQQAAAVLKAGTSAASANVSFEELVGSIEMLGEKGIKGEIAGTGLKKFFLVLQTGAAETNPKVVGLSTALDNLKAKVDAAEKQTVGGGASFLKKMFGEEAFAIASILSDNTHKVKEYTAAVTGTITATEQAAINSDTSAAKLAQLRNKIKEAGIELIEKLNPSLGILANWSSKLISILPALFDTLIACKGSISSLATAIIAYNLYVQRSIILDKLKVFWQEKIVYGYNKIKMSMKSNPWGLAVTGVALLVGAMIDLVRASNRVSKAQKELNDISKDARHNMAEERNQLDILVSAARNETLSLDERQKAINKLNQIIPDYNASLDDTSGKYRENKAALDQYIKSLTRKYELEGAKKRLSEIGTEKADAQIEVDAARKVLEKAKSTAQSGQGHSYTTSWGSVGNTATDLTAQASSVLARAEAKLEEIKNRESAILESYGVDLQKQAVNKKPVTPTETPTVTTSNAVKNEVDETKTAIDRLNDDLEKVKNEYQALEIQNLASYIAGTKDYSKYLEDKERLDSQYLQRQIETHENHNKVDLSGYVSLLAQRAKEKESADDKMRQLDIEYIEQHHRDLEDGIIKDFYNPNGVLFQNEVALNQRLLEENKRYLEEKRDAYTEDSEEYIAYEKEIQDLIAKDQLDKQKELAEAIMKYRRNYGDNGRRLQYQAEIKMLDMLHKEGLIKEEEYQKALNKLRKKFSNEDAGESFKAFDDAFEKIGKLFGGKLPEIHQKITDWLKNLSEEERSAFFELFEKGFDNVIGKTLAESLNGTLYLIEGFSELVKGNWKGLISNLGEMAQGAANIIGGIMSTFSSYWDAERDIEVSKAEKRYDKEIEAAGKNEKKKKKLEEQKEKEIAAIKNKYNNRAMKLEIAQAIAQTAVNALGHSVLWLKSLSLGLHLLRQLPPWPPQPA